MSIEAQIRELASASNIDLGKRFLMPTDKGSSIDAIAFTSRVASTLVSLYSLMLQAIALQIWCLVVTLIMAFVVKTRHLPAKISSNMGVANVAIWNAQASPRDVARAMWDYKGVLPIYATMWTALALFAWAGSVSLSTFVTPSLVIGQAGPVKSSKVWTTYTPAGAPNSFLIILKSINSPRSFRAIDVLQAVNSTDGQVIDSHEATTGAVAFSSRSSVLADGSPFGVIDYAYNISGYQFGLQRAPDLVHAVRGSCYTEYGWYTGNTSSVNPNYVIDHYDWTTEGGSHYRPNISAAELKGPLLETGLHKLVKGQENSPNMTFHVLVSALQRRSFTESTDPWYQTEFLSTDNATNEATFAVKTGRPVLSCWQNDLWIRKGKALPITRVSELDGVSPAIAVILKASLSSPRIINLIQGLGPAALQSATTSSIGLYFDAGAASMVADMRRLIFASYIATKNTLLETTLTNHELYDIKNKLCKDPLAATCEILPGSGDFIVPGIGIQALSVRFLIVVPVVLAGLFLVMYLVGENSFLALGWNAIYAMKATVLYSSIDTEHFKGGESEPQTQWKRMSSPIHERGAKSFVRPEYNRVNSTYSWHAVSPPAVNKEVEYLAQPASKPVNVEDKASDLA